MITSNLYYLYNNNIKTFYYFRCEIFLDKFKIKCKNFGKDNLLLLFDVLNYIVEQGNMNVWVSVSSKKFLTFILDILKSQSDAEIQTKLLQLIQNWGTDFENKKDVIPNFYKIYNKFRVNGVVFPPREESNYYKYITKNTVAPKENKYEDIKFNENNEDNCEEDDSNENEEFAYIESIKNKLKASNFDHKYRRLVAYLAKMHDNIKTANIAIDKRNLNNLKEAINTIKKGNKTLIDTIGSGRLKDEKLMEITLGTTEDINQTIAREEEMKSGNKPNKFVSYFVLNEIIPMKSNMRSRAKSEKKKINLNQRGNLNNNNELNNNNNNNNNIKNADDIFDLFSSNQPNNANNNTNFPGNMFNNNNNNQDNNIMTNIFSNQNSNNNNFMNNNNFNNNDNMIMNNQINNNMNNNNFNQNNVNNQLNNIDLLQGNINLNSQQNNNMNQNMNNNMSQNKRFNQNEFDMYGPSPEINSDQLVHYIGPINNNNNGNNNNQFTGFNNNNQNNNMFSQNTQLNNNFGNNIGNNNMGNNMGNNMNGNFNQQQMTAEEIEREQRLKELDDLF